MGGGPSVDILRQRFQSGTLANDAAHWAAIARMSETAAGLARTMPGVPLLKSFAACRRLPSGLAILDPQLELRADAGRTLPVGWDVTSDSIAAWCAMRLCASRLSLLKSVGKGDPIDVGDAIRDGWLDGHFPSLWDAWIAHRCRVEWINLRHHPPTAAPLVRRRTAML